MMVAKKFERSHVCVPVETANIALRATLYGILIANNIVVPS